MVEKIDRTTGTLVISNIQLKALFDSIGEPIIILNVERGEHFSFAMLNLAAEKFFGISNDVYTGMKVDNLEGLDSTRAAQRKQSIEVYKRCVATKEPIVNETRHLKKDGSYRWGRNTHVPIFNENNEVHQIMITSVDITELIESRNSLEEALTKTLSGFVTICSYCKSIKDDKHQWLTIDMYAAKHMDYHQFSHGMCPSCYERQIKDVSSEN